MTLLLHGEQVGLIAETAFVLAGVVIAVAAVWFALASTGAGRRRRPRRSVDQDNND